MIIKVPGIREAKELLRELNDDPELLINDNKIYQSISSGRSYKGARFTYDLPNGCERILMYAKAKDIKELDKIINGQTGSNNSESKPNANKSKDNSGKPKQTR